MMHSIYFDFDDTLIVLSMFMPIYPECYGDKHLLRLKAMLKGFIYLFFPKFVRVL